MSLFICEKCGSIENTALGSFWGHDRLLCSTRIKHYSPRRSRGMKRAALGAAVVELRRLSRWAGERVAAIEAGEGDQG